MNLRNTENTIVLGVFLGLTATVAGLVLAYFSDLTAGPIAEARLRHQAQSLEQVLPSFANNPVEHPVVIAPEKGVSGTEVTFFVARDAEGKIVGVAGSGATMKGYSGRIVALVGLLPDGAVRTVLITENNETPGLGSNVCNRTAVRTLKTLFDGRKSDALPPNPILDSFDGLSAGDAPWKITKDGGSIPYRTGATISSRAVTEITYIIARTYLLNRDRILEGK